MRASQWPEYRVRVMRFSGAAATRGGGHRGVVAQPCDPIERCSHEPQRYLAAARIWPVRAMMPIPVFCVRRRVANRLMYRFSALALVMSVGGCVAMSQIKSVTELEKEVVGAWRLVKTQQTLADGTVRPKPAYGPNGKGYIIYDPAHVMCVFLANPDAPITLPGQPRGEPGSSMDSPAAYCGRWRIDPDGPKVIHLTEMDVFPQSLSQNRGRLFKREGDLLYLRPAISDPGVVDYFLAFQKVRD